MTSPSSPPLTVNALMQWLRTTLGILVPVLPLKGWTAKIRAFWSRPVAGELPDPSKPKPWVFSVPGEWPELLPSNSKVKVQDIKITVRSRTSD